MISATKNRRSRRVVVLFYATKSRRNRRFSRIGFQPQRTGEAGEWWYYSMPQRTVETGEIGENENDGRRIKCKV